MPCIPHWGPGRSTASIALSRFAVALSVAEYSRVSPSSLSAANAIGMPLDSPGSTVSSNAWHMSEAGTGREETMEFE